MHCNETKGAGGVHRWGLTVFAMQANEMTEGLREKLPPTDSRLRTDLRHLEHGNYDKVHHPATTLLS